MTSSQQSFTTADMTALINAFDWAKDNFSDTRVKVNTHCSNIEANWQGQAPQAFTQAMMTFETKLGLMITDCQDLIEKLTKAGGTYDQQVQDMSQAGSDLARQMEGVV